MLPDVSFWCVLLVKVLLHFPTLCNHPEENLLFMASNCVRGFIIEGCHVSHAFLGVVDKGHPLMPNRK